MGVKGSKAELEDLYDEMADVFIAADLMAMHLGVNVGAAIERSTNRIVPLYLRFATFAENN